MILLQRSKCLRCDAASLGKRFPLFKRTQKHIPRNFNLQSHRQKPRTLHTMASLNADTISCKNEDSIVSCQVKYVLGYFMVLSRQRLPWSGHPRKCGSKFGGDKRLISSPNYPDQL